MLGPAQRSGASTAVMLSPDSVDRGIIPRVMERLFQSIALAPPRVSYEVRCSYIEIYNEQVYDLLSGSKEPLRVRATDDSIEMFVVGDDDVKVFATEVLVADGVDVLRLMQRGAAHRAVAETAGNQRSSRSHTVFTAKLSAFDGDTAVTTFSELFLVDLAGSEKVALVSTPLVVSVVRV
jgi:kinesin family protein 5